MCFSKYMKAKLMATRLKPNFYSAEYKNIKASNAELFR